MIKLTDHRQCECYDNDDTDGKRCERRSDVFIKEVNEDTLVAACLEHAFEFVLDSDYEVALEEVS